MIYQQSGEIEYNKLVKKISYYTTTVITIYMNNNFSLHLIIGK